MNQFNGYLWMAVFGTFGTVVVAALLYAWLARRALHIQQSIFANWPLSERPLVNTEECQVLHWMCKTFPMHQVNIKIPVTRFTQPLERRQGESLHKILDGVYCTFTVCSPDGHVVGCADVMGANGLASRNRQLKQALLAKCGIAYCVLKPVSLPAQAAIRSDFLGETVPAEPVFKIKPREERHRELEEALLAEARLKLSTVLTRQRRIRDSEFAPLAANSCSHAVAHASQGSFEEVDASGHGMLAGWQHNSFLAPLESRPR